MTRRLFAPQPGYMALTFAGALLIAGGGGVVTETLLDKQAAAGTLEERAELRVVEELTARGWIASDHRDARKLAEERRVVVLTAHEPFALQLAHGRVTGEPPAESDANLATETIRRELLRYPPDFFGRSRFARVLLCRDLTEAGAPIPSLPNYERTLLLDVRGPADFVRRLVHHEIYHFVDYTADDRLDLDPEWEALNPAGFSYGMGGRGMRRPAAGRQDDRAEGFMTPYATSALAEDKAELFSFLMVAPAYVAERAVSDPVLRAKARLLEKRIAERHPGFRKGALAPILSGP